MATINFQELRRMERRRVREERRLKNTAPNFELASSCGIVSENQQHQNAGACVSPPFDTLLPKNVLSNAIHQIKTTANIDSVFYAERFLPEEVIEQTMAWLQTVPDHLQRGNSSGLSEEQMSLLHNGKWTRLKHARRKVALFDGTLSSCVLPPILQRMSDTLVRIGAFPSSNAPNHVLINEYQTGEGIMAHTDGPAYHSCTATISLGGSDVIFQLRPRQYFNGNEIRDETRYNQRKLDVILHGNGSLIVFRGDAYLEHTHGISEGVFEETTKMGLCGNDLSGGTNIKRGYRISLTFRCKKSE